MTMNRRRFLELATAGASLPALGMAARATAAARASVVIIGGGFGGATCAKYLRRLDPAIKVTLVEKSTVYVTCPFSNLVLGGLRAIDDITQVYDGLQALGVELIRANAATVDPTKRAVTLADGKTLHYDRLVLAPGVELRFDAVEGYDAAASETLPHAWKAGPQTIILRRQLEAMADGGTVIIAVPGEPYRCPPGPYERASLIAHYLKQKKPKSKILILDAKDKFSKQALFMQGWQALYPGMIEWVAGSKGGIVAAVDATTKTLRVQEGFDEHRGDVVNFIPLQKAGAIAARAGLTDASGWCPVDPLTFESTLQPGVHVIGDAASAGAMPKSGFSANSQAKVCAAAVVAAFGGVALSDPSYVNTCYSLVGPEYGISVSAVYRLKDGKIAAVEGAGGVSPADADAEFRAKEARYTAGWYASIVSDTFA